ncbi:efflux RND transporter permease subunit [Leptospira sp. 96542]|nr:efflux RND transporter permease subunit [Leptospira sp. 96542]
MSSFCENRPKLQLVLLLLLSLFGLLNVQKVRFIDLREIIHPAILIAVTGSGADIPRMEEIVTNPIENAIATIGGIVELRSTIEIGKSNTYIRFNEGSDVKKKSVELRERIDLVSQKFPGEIHKPQLIYYDPTKKPQFILSFESKKLNTDVLREKMETLLKHQLEKIKGIALVEFVGGKISEIQIGCDPAKLEIYQISLLEVIRKIQNQNVNHSIDIRESSLSNQKIYLNDRIGSLADLENLPILIFKNEHSVRLKDLANIGIGKREDGIISRTNGKERVAIYIYTQNNADIFFISDSIHELISGLEIDSLEVEIQKDAAQTLRIKLNQIYTIIVFILIFQTLVQYKNYLKNSVLFIFFSYAISFFIIIFFYFIFKQSFSIYGCYASIVAMSLSFFYTNFKIWISKKNPNLHLKIQVFLVFHFFIFAVYYLNRPFFYIFTEFFYVLFFFLMLSVHLSNLLNQIFTSEILNIKYSIFSFSKNIFKIIKFNSYSQALRNKYTENFYLFPISILFLLFLGLYEFMLKDISGITHNETKEIYAYLEFPPGTSIAYTNQISKLLEERLKNHPPIEDIISKIEPAHIFYLIKFKEMVSPDFALFSSLKKLGGNLGEGYLYFSGDKNQNYQNEIIFDLTGPEISEMESIISEIYNQIKDEDGVGDLILRFKPTREELDLNYNANKFNHSGISLQEYGDELRIAIQGGVASKIVLTNRELDVRVRYAEIHRGNLKDLSQYKIRNKNQQFVPAENLVDLRLTKVPSKIYHKDKQRTLSFSIVLEDNFESIKNIVSKGFKNLSLGLRYRLEVQNEFKENINTNFYKWVFFLFYFILNLIFLIQNKISPKDLEFYSPILIYFPFVYTMEYFFQTNFDLNFQLGLLLAIFLHSIFQNQLIFKPMLSRLFILIVFLNFAIGGELSPMIIIFNCLLFYSLFLRIYIKIGKHWVYIYKCPSILDFLKFLRTDFQKKYLSYREKRKQTKFSSI